MFKRDLKRGEKIVVARIVYELLMVVEENTQQQKEQLGRELTGEECEYIVAMVFQQFNVAIMLMQGPGWKGLSDRCWRQPDIPGTGEA